MKQATVKAPISLSGTGLHSGTTVNLSILPAAERTGISFVRTDITDKNNRIPVLWDNVIDTKLCTVIGNEDGVSVGTIEHVMAALRGCGVDNAILEIDGPEVPVMDGSSAAFVEAIDRSGLVQQDAPRVQIKVLKEVCVKDGDKYVRLLPGNSSAFAGEIEFDHPSIGFQRREITLVNGNFRHDLADSRTFGFLHEVEALRAMGLARGGSLDNAIVLDQDKVLNPSGLRHGDEFIRHKLLDAIGDLYLAGGVIIGTYESYKGGHALNNAVLHKLFAQKDAWTLTAGVTDTISSGRSSSVNREQQAHLTVSAQ